MYNLQPPFLLPGFSLPFCVCFGVSSPGEILKLGGGDKFGD